MIIKFVGLASGGDHPILGKFLKAYNARFYPPSGVYDGGALEITDDPEKALQFATALEAMQYWQTQAPFPHDLRPDGKPNRPLTAFTVEIVLLDTTPAEPQ